MADCPCSRPADPILCRTCYTTLVSDVARIPYTLGRLRPIINKTARAGAAVRAPGTGSRPPLNLEALEAAEALKQLHEVAKRNDLAMLARHEWILTYQADLAHANHRARLVLEPPAARVILGPCTVADVSLGEDRPVYCAGSLLAFEGELEARCDVCGETYSVRAYRVGRVLDALGGDGTPVRAADAARRLTDAGIKTTTTDLKNWVRAGRLAPVAQVQDGKRSHGLYSMADVYAIASRRAA